MAIEAKNIALSQEILAELESIDMSALTHDMVQYSMYRIYGNGRQDAEELVSFVFEKLIDGTRKWNKSMSLRECLFGALRSDVSNFNRKWEKNPLDRYEDDIHTSKTEQSALDRLSTDELKQLAVARLKGHNPPPDYLEELIFECWMDGNNTPREVADYLGVEVTEIYKGVKRLERKLEPVRKLFKSMGYD